MPTRELPSCIIDQLFALLPVSSVVSTGQLLAGAQVTRNRMVR